MVFFFLPFFFFTFVDRSYFFSQEHCTRIGSNVIIILRYWVFFPRVGKIMALQYAYRAAKRFVIKNCFHVFLLFIICFGNKQVLIRARLMCSTWRKLVRYRTLDALQHFFWNYKIIRTRKHHDSGCIFRFMSAHTIGCQLS